MTTNLLPSPASTEMSVARKTRQTPRMFVFGILLAVIAGFFASTAAPAQTRRLARVEIPFAFMIGDEELPAGQYDVTDLTSTGGATVAFRHLDSGKSFITRTRSLTGETAPETLRFEFVTAENHRYLTRMWTAYGTPGLEVAVQPSVKVVREQLRVRKNPVSVPVN